MTLTITNFAKGARGVGVAWLCEEMGLDYRVRRVAYPVPADYRARHPLGAVPFLEDGDVAISETVAILLYVAQKHGATPLLPAPDDPAFARVLQMTVFGEATLGAATNSLMVDRFAVAEKDRGGALQKAIASRVEQTIGFVRYVLRDQPYIAGDRFTVADISVSTALTMWSGPVGGALDGTLADYQARTAARPAYQRARKANE